MSDLSDSLKAYMKSIREIEKAEEEYEWGHEREYDEMRRAENVFLDELIEAIAERKRDRG